MPTSYNVAQSKRLGAAILKFLEYHGQNARLTPDQEEGVSVAIQCLSFVFDAKPEDAKDIPELMEVYSAKKLQKTYHNFPPISTLFFTFFL